jgi:hypothetical protein
MPKPLFFSRAVAVLVLSILAAACDSPATPSPPGSPPGRLEILTTNTLAPQQTTEVRAFLVGQDGAREDVTTRVRWTTSDSAVLSMSSAGLFTGVAVGEAIVRAILGELSGSTTVIVVPAGTFRLAGVVTAPGSTRPLAGAQVQLITASGDVLTSVSAGPAGLFRFYGVAGPARLRISRRAFQPYEAEIDIQGHLTHDVSLSMINLRGTYTMTLTASSGCRLELPEPVRTRTYSATVDQQDESLTVTLPEGLAMPGFATRFTGVFDEANDVTFELHVEEWWLQQPATEFHASGRMRVRLVEAGLTGFLDGEMEAIVTNEGGRGNRIVTCSAPDHGAAFLRDPAERR